MANWTDPIKFVFNPSVSWPQIFNTFVKENTTYLYDQVVSLLTAITGPAGGSLAGNYPNPTIAANAVGSAEIASGAVGSDELATNSVGTDEIQAGAVKEAEIDDNAVISRTINALAVTTAKIDNLAVTTDKIAAQAVTDPSYTTAGSDDNTTDTNYDNMADMAVTRSGLVASRDIVLIFFTGYVKHSANPGGVRVALTIDGSDDVEKANVSFSADDDYACINFCHLHVVTGTSHTYQVRYKVTVAGTATVLANRNLIALVLRK